MAALVLRVKFPNTFPVIYKTLRVDCNLTTLEAIEFMCNSINVPFSQDYVLYNPEEKRHLDGSTPLSEYEGLQEAEHIELQERLDPGPIDGCFVRGTMITMQDGSKKPIECIEVGDFVHCFDFTTNTTQTGKIQVVKRSYNNRLMKIQFDDRTTLTSSFNHPYWVENKRGWCVGEIPVDNHKNFGKLEEGDTCCKAISTEINISKKDCLTNVQVSSMDTCYFEQMEPVFDLSVVPYGNLFVNNILVSNKQKPFCCAVV